MGDALKSYHLQVDMCFSTAQSPQELYKEGALNIVTNECIC